MADISAAVDEAAKLLKGRIKELEGEIGKLQRALGQLTEGRRKPGRPKGSGTKAKRSRRKPGRKRATRADQAVKMIKDNPGITASEMAKRMKIKPNYLYRVLGDLQKEGRVKKSGRKYTAA